LKATLLNKGNAAQSVVEKTYAEKHDHASASTYIAISSLVEM